LKEEKKQPTFDDSFISLIFLDCSDQRIFN